MNRAERISARAVRSWLPRRSPDSHKGDYGHVLVVAGSRGMSGAAVLCSWGALRGGAGLVTAAVPKSQQPIVAQRIRPEAMTLALPETRGGGFSPRASSALLGLMKARKVSSIAAGSGLSRTPEAGAAVRRMLERLKPTERFRAIVLDADGFLAFKPKGRKDPLRELAKRFPVIVTPHPGEFAAFLGVSVARVQSRRLETAREFARLYGIVCVLKGHGTLVSDGRRTFVNPTGNPGMATGGSGDVLAGLIAALTAQTKGALEAAAAGVYLHGLAGDLAARDKSEVGLLAGDIAEAIPDALKTILGK